MNTSPANGYPLSHPAVWTSPHKAADRVMAECRQARGFQTEQEFWTEFGRIYSRVEQTVRPDQRFAFVMHVDGHLAEMGLAPWSIMSRLGTPEGPHAQQPTVP